MAISIFNFLDENEFKIRFRRALLTKYLRDKGFKVDFIENNCSLSYVSLLEQFFFNRL